MRLSTFSSPDSRPMYSNSVPASCSAFSSSSVFISTLFGEAYMLTLSHSGNMRLTAALIFSCSSLLRMNASPSAKNIRFMLLANPRARSRSAITSSVLLMRNCFSLYIVQKAQRLWLHPMVDCTIRLYASLGGRNMRPS